MFGFAPISSTPISSLPSGALATYSKTYYTNIRLSPTEKTNKISLYSKAQNTKLQTTNILKKATTQIQQTSDAKYIKTNFAISSTLIFIKATNSKANTQNNLIQAEAQKTQITDTLNIKSQNIIHTALAEIKATAAKDTNLVSYKKATINQITYLNILLLLKTEKTSSIEAYKQATIAIQSQINANKKALNEKAHIIDSQLLATQSQTSLTNALANYVGTGNHNTKSLIRDTYNKTTSTNIIAKATRILNMILNSYLIKTTRVTHHTYLNIIATNGKNQNINMLKYLKSMLGQNIKAYIKSAAGKNQTSNLLKKQSNSNAYTTDIRKAFQYIKSTVLNSLFKKANQKTAKSNAKLFRTTSAINYSDMLIKKFVNITQTINIKLIALKIKTHISRSLIKLSGIKITLANAYLKKRINLSQSVQNLKIAGKTKIINTNIKIVNSIIIQHQTGSWFKTTNILRQYIASRLTGTVSKIARTSLQKRSSNSKPYVTKSLLRLRTSINILASGLIIRLQTKSMSARSRLLKQSVRNINIYLLLRKRQSISVTTASYKRSAGVLTQKINSFKIKNIIKSHSSNLISKSTFARMHDTMAIFYYRGVLAHGVISAGIKTLGKVYYSNLLKKDSTNPKHKTNTLMKDINKYDLNTNLLKIGQIARNSSSNSFIDNDAPNGYFDDSIFSDSFWEVSVF